MQNVANGFPVRFRSELGRSQAALQEEIKIGKQDDGSVLTPEQRKKEEENVRDG